MTVEKQEGLIDPLLVAGIIVLLVLMITLIINHIAIDVTTPLIVIVLMLALGTGGQIRRLKHARQKKGADDEH